LDGWHRWRRRRRRRRRTMSRRHRGRVGRLRCLVWGKGWSRCLQARRDLTKWHWPAAMRLKQWEERRGRGDSSRWRWSSWSHIIWMIKIDEFWKNFVSYGWKISSYMRETRQPSPLTHNIFILSVKKLLWHVDEYMTYTSTRACSLFFSRSHGKKSYVSL